MNAHSGFSHAFIGIREPGCVQGAELQDETDTDLGLLELIVSEKGRHWTHTDKHKYNYMWDKRFGRKQQRRGGAWEGLCEEEMRCNGEGRRKSADQGICSHSSPLWTLPLSSSHLTGRASPFPRLTYCDKNTCC